MEYILNDIFNKITTIPLNEPIFIYTGVGSAAYLIKNENDELYLEPQNYQQYPPFLQNLKNTISNLHLFIILIDPCLENPPYIVNDIGLEQLNNDNENYKKHNIDYYSNQNKIYLYTYKKDVYTDPHREFNNAVNITTHLRKLNNYAVINNITTLYHNYTGIANNILAEFFDQEIIHNLDHIIYGLSARQDHGCQFDLTANSSYFPFKIYNNSINNERAIVKLFNIFSYILSVHTNYKYHLENQYNIYPVYMHNMINEQKKQVINNIKKNLRNNTFPILRIIARLITGDEKLENIKNIDFLENLPPLISPKAVELYNNKQHYILYYYLIDYFSIPLDIVVNLQNLDLTGKEMLEFIINDVDIYKWYDNINDFF